MKEEIEILSTRELNESTLSGALQKGIRIEVSPFIKTEPIESVEVQQEIESIASMRVKVVFSSANAVEAVATYAAEFMPEWEIFCVGKSTAQRAKKFFSGSVMMGIQSGAAELATSMLEEMVADEIYFFCGDRRRDELPDLLRTAGVEVNEIVVYQTISMPHKIRKNYSGILFFSPSGADAFFESNKTADNVPLFAIGETTAAAVRRYCNNPVLIPENPSAEELVDEVVDYFT